MTTPISPAVQVPLHAPDYTASFTTAVRRFYARWLRFKGRASRREYWWAFLFQVLVGALVGFFCGLGDARMDSTVLTGIVAPLVLVVAFLVPNLSLTWRRLHDAGFAGPWYFLSFIPFLGTIAVLILCALPTSEKFNPKWADPEGGSAV